MGAYEMGWIGTVTPTWQSWYPHQLLSFALFLVVAIRIWSKRKMVTRFTHIHPRPLPAVTNEWWEFQLITERRTAITFVVGQVSKIHRFTDFLIRRPAQLHVHAGRLRYRYVTVGRSLKDDGHLAMNVGLGEGAFGLPAVIREESHLNVVWKKGGWWEDSSGKLNEHAKRWDSWTENKGEKMNARYGKSSDEEISWS